MATGLVFSLPFFPSTKYSSPPTFLSFPVASIVTRDQNGWEKTRRTRVVGRQPDDDVSQLFRSFATVLLLSKVSVTVDDDDGMAPSSGDGGFEASFMAEAFDTVAPQHSQRIVSMCKATLPSFHNEGCNRTLSASFVFNIP